MKGLGHKTNLHSKPNKPLVGASLLAKSSRAPRSFRTLRASVDVFREQARSYGAKSLTQITMAYN